MTKEFVPYNEALELKELGFDEECFGLFVKDKSLLIKQMPNQQECEQYFGGILAPTFSQAFRFFREKYNLRNSIMDFDFIIDKRIGIKWDYEISIIGSNKLDENGNYKVLVDYSIDDETREFKTYEEAELACLQKLIQIVKDNIEIEVDSYDYKEATQITEKIAIEFAEWIRIKDFQPDSLIKSNIVGGLGVWSGESYFTSKDNWIGLDMKYYTSEELFQEFIKQRQ